MTDKVAINRLRTGVPGLDELLGGGLPELSFNLISGPPGSGKTTLGHQIMFALATPERPALYFTVLGEPPLKMLRYQQQFDFFRGEALDKSIRFLNIAEEALTGDADQVLHRITTEVEAHGPAFVFVDSFRPVLLASTAANRHNALQHFIQQLGLLMTSWQATTFLIGEYADDLDDNPVFTVADGLIWLRQCVQRNSVVRKIEIVKMRAQATLPGLHAFRISARGIEVFPPAVDMVVANVEASAAAGQSRLAIGVPGLDEMLGGGLPRGYSLLVAGPSGSGKSILAAAFLAEGVRCGEAGVVAAFEEPVQRSRNRLLAQLIDSGRVGQVSSQALDLSFDEMVLALMQEVRRLDAKRVVIDSLSGFELALAPTFRDDFRESLGRMVAALAGAGVTVLVTSQLEDRYTDLRFSPYGTSFLTDAIIVQRYIEIDGRLRRLMAVVKVRASAHSDELREFTIDADGLRIGERIAGCEGLLGGSPTRKHVVPLPPPRRAADGGNATDGQHPA